MKKLLLLFVMVALIATYSQAQTMPIPASNVSNTLFLKYSQTLNSPYSYLPKVNISTTRVRDFKPVYSFISDAVKNASSSIMEDYFYVIEPEEFAYIDPTLYNSVSLSREQLIDILKTKTITETKAYLDSFTTIYLIDYEQKNPSNSNQVKILRVKPFYNFYRY
jgi:hypothetical protein